MTTEIHVELGSDVTLGELSDELTRFFEEDMDRLNYKVVINNGNKLNVYGSTKPYPPDGPYVFIEL